MRDLVSFQFNNNSYNANHYKTRLIGTSDCNMFVPFFSLFAHELVEFEENDIRLIEYALPGEPLSHMGIRQYSQLINTLSNAVQPVKYNYKLSGVDKSINLHRGLIYSEE